MMPEMPGPYSPKSIANSFLQKAFNDEKVVGHLKLQKLVYLAHGYYLAATIGTPLVDELFDVRDYGPVCRNLYNEFRDFGKAPINRLAMGIAWNDAHDYPVPAPIDDPIVGKVVDFVYKTYAGRPALALSSLIHQPGWAWDRARKSNELGLKNIRIPNDLIRNDFGPYVKSLTSDEVSMPSSPIEMPMRVGGGGKRI